MTGTHDQDRPVDWDSLLAFLPVFDTPGVEAGTVISNEETEDGTAVFPYWDYTAQVAEFMQTVYESGAILVGFDWPSWQDQAVRYVNHPDDIASVDLDTCRRLLTTHVRKDRFMDGHFGEMVESGHIAAVLKRVQQIVSDG